MVPRSQAVQQGDREQNRNPNAQMGIGAAKDLRGKMTAAMHAGQGASAFGKAPASMNILGQAGHQQVAGQALSPYSCFSLFRPMSARDGRQEGTATQAAARRNSASSNESLGDEHFLKEFHRDDQANFPESIAAAPSPIRGLDGSCTIIDQDHSGEWGNMAEASSTFMHDSDEHVASGVQRGMAQPGRSTVHNAEPVQPLQITQDLRPRVARHMAVADVSVHAPQRKHASRAVRKAFTKKKDPAVQTGLHASCMKSVCTRIHDREILFNWHSV